MSKSSLRCDQVLVTVGTAYTMSAVGSTETYQALVAQSEEFLPLAAFDAGLVELDPAAARVRRGPRGTRPGAAQRRRWHALGTGRTGWPACVAGRTEAPARCRPA